MRDNKFDIPKPFFWHISYLSIINSSVLEQGKVGTIMTMFEMGDLINKLETVLYNARKLKEKAEKGEIKFKEEEGE
jgi:hypothetical protein